MTRILGATSLVLLASIVSIGSQQAPPRDLSPFAVPVVEVQRLSELRAKTDTERAIANLLSFGGPPLRPADEQPREEVVIAEVPMRPTPLDGGTRQRVPDVCMHSAVVMGTIVQRTVILNAPETALLTVNTVKVDRWVYPLTGPSEITVASAGGKALVAGRLYETQPSMYHLPERAPLLLYLDTPTKLDRFYLPRRSIESVTGRLEIEGRSGPESEVVDALKRDATACAGGQSR